MSERDIIKQIQRIEQLPENDQRYLYGECDKWCLENFEEDLQIVAIMERDNYENGITHSYLRDPDNRLCYDVRGESDCDEEIIAYTGVDYYSNNIEEYVFNNVEDFKMFLKWIDFEAIRKDYLVG